MPLLQERSDLAAVAIAEKHDRSQQVGTVIRAARLRAVTGHALRNPDVLALFGERKVDEGLVSRSRRSAASPAAT